MNTLITQYDKLIAPSRLLKFSLQVFGLLIVTKFVSVLTDIPLHLTFFVATVLYIISSLLLLRSKQLNILRLESKEWEEINDSLKLALATREEQLARVAKTVQTLQRDKTRFEEELSSERVAHSSLRKRWDETYFAYTSLETNYKSLQVEFDSLQSANDSLDTRLSSLTSDNNSLSGLLEKAKTKVESLENGCGSLQSDNDSLREELETLRTKNRSLQNTVNGLRRK